MRDWPLPERGVPGHRACDGRSSVAVAFAVEGSRHDDGEESGSCQFLKPEGLGRVCEAFVDACGSKSELRGLVCR